MMMVIIITNINMARIKRKKTKMQKITIKQQKKTEALKSLRHNQHGVMLIGLLLFMVFIGMIIVSLLTLLAAEARMQIVDVNQRRALYAAESGIEYAMRLISEYALYNSFLLGLSNYSETVETGPGARCQINIHIIGTNKIRIKATGKSQNFARVIEKTLEYIDVAKYAVYATGDVKYIRTIPHNKVMENAKYFPLFDPDELRQAAKPYHYYPGNLTINGWFNFIKNVAFVEKNLTFGKFNWLNIGNFAVGGDVRIKPSWMIFGVTSGVIFQFNPGSRFQCDWQFVWRALSGGIITNGDVIGTSKPFWHFRFRVYYNRFKIAKFFKYSVNGGPLIFKSTQLKIY
ncbi:pilus assembly PilX N-terminal domain-containing protein [Calditrichota bacterium LG25]